jgi:hypothetical protein
MPRQTHTVQTGTGKYPVLADVDELVWLAADPDGNFEEVEFTGREIILARNVSPDTALDVTITSAASSRTGRTGNIVKEVGFGEQICIGPLGTDGWKQSDGMLYFAGEDSGDDGDPTFTPNPGIEFAVVRL